MKKFELKVNPNVQVVFDKYPDTVRNKIQQLRRLIIETAQETEGLTTIEETLKWGEPSYLTKKGSTIRIDWKPKNPDQYAMYFKCTSRLVETFKVIFHTQFEFEGHRAIVFKMDDVIPESALKSCIKTALTYHQVKHLPTLGI